MLAGVIFTLPVTICRARVRSDLRSGIVVFTLTRKSALVDCIVDDRVDGRREDPNELSNDIAVLPVSESWHEARVLKPGRGQNIEGADEDRL